MLRTDSWYKFILSFVVIILISGVLSKNCYSVEPEEFLKNTQQELRARNISKNVRCLVCQNQSIDESSAPLAKDLRNLIRKKITEGSADKEIYKFLTERYGDFILLKPLVKKNTYALWLLPFVLFFIGITILYWHNRKSNEKLHD